jgi:citryl-CoA lyase
MYFKTSITNITPEGKEFIRGFDLEILAESSNFGDTIFLLLLGRKPNGNESKMWNALLVMAIDHGPGTASALTARISASAKNSVHTSLAAGLLGLGERHGLAIEGAMKFFLEHKNVENLQAFLQNMKEQKKYVPGYGHKVLSVDSRANALLKIAKVTGFYKEHCAFAEAVQEALKNTSSKVLPLNVDGAMAAVLCDMDIGTNLAKGIFMIARVPGLVAHIVEEIKNDDGIRRVDLDDIEYIDE